MTDPLVYATALLAYLLGSIPFGLMLTHLAGLGDVRTIGSGNIGATNVLRTGNAKLAAITLVFDIGKGAAAVLIAWQFGPDAAAVAAVFAVLGHMFPLWLKFKGGKGVATAAGVFLAYAWPVGLAAMATWIAAAAIWRYSSLAALLAAAAALAYAWLFGPRDAESVTVLLVIALLVVLRHHANIRRLLNGTESKISFGKKPA